MATHHTIAAFAIACGLIAAGAVLMLVAHAYGQGVPAPTPGYFCGNHPEKCVIPDDDHAFTTPRVAYCTEGWTPVYAYGRAMCARELREVEWR